MITAIKLKRGTSRIVGTNILTLDTHAFAVQSGLLVIRAARDGRVTSIPLSDVEYIEGCPAAPPALKRKA